MKVFYPEDKIKIIWNVVLIVTVLLSSLIFPYRILSGQNPFDLLFWIITIVFFLDIIVEFFSAFHKGINIITDLKEIKKKYLKTFFLVDLLAALPLGLIGLLLKRNDIVMILMGIRLLKLIKIKDAFKSLQDVLDLNPGLMRLIIFGFWFILIVHFMSIGWLAIGAGQREGPFLHRYIQSLYWCITTIATIGYGDITPDRTNILHVIYTIIVELFGVSMYGFIIGNISSLIANLDVSRTAFKRKMEEVREYMRSRHIPHDIQKRVKEYYEYLWDTRKSTGSENVLSELPHTLSTDIAMFLNRHILEKVSIFKDAGELFLREVVKELNLIVFLPGDYIIRQGEHADCMYFISSGEVEVTVNDKVVAKLESGSFFGETALLEGGVRTASVRALTYCETYRLAKSDFDNLRTKYPNFDLKVRKIMEERLHQIKK